VQLRARADDDTQKLRPSPHNRSVVAALSDVVAHLDRLLDTHQTPDYPNALNGLQVANAGQVTRVAAAVDGSRRAIDGAVSAGADLLLLHHGLFWGGVQSLTGFRYERIRTLITQGIAVYSAHLPLDRHPSLGNNVLLAHALGLTPAGAFARYESIAVGVRGTSDIATATLVDRAAAFAEAHGGSVRASAFHPDRRTRSWALCTGAGASAETLDEAAALGVDTLIVGEGPHWTAVDAPERGLVIVYAGHYATETLGVQALARELHDTFGLPWSFIDAPTGT